MSGYQFRFRRQLPGWLCPYCGKPVGYLGRAFAWLFGVSIHGCDFSNVKNPRDE